MRIFVTGAASPLGRAVTDTLVRRGHRVLGLVRRRSGVAQVNNLGADAVVGDIRVAGPWTGALDGCEVVFHLASYFDFWASAPETFNRVNVMGTRHTMDAAVSAGVRRVVFCSSALTLSDPGRAAPGGIAMPSRPQSDFERSQRQAERYTLALRERGVEVVVVNPGLVVAPSDQGWTGRLIADCVGGRAHLAAHARVGWLWVHDLALGLVQAAELGVDGTRYALAGDSLSSHAFLSLVAKRAGVSAPRAYPAPLAMGEAALATAVGRAFNRRPRLTVDEARFLSSGFTVDGRRAAAALDLEYTPLVRYLPTLVSSYQQAAARFGGPRAPRPANAAGGARQSPGARGAVKPKS